MTTKIAETAWKSLRFAGVFGLCSSMAWGQSTIEIGFFDKDSGEPISARIEFTEPVNRYPKPKGALVAGRQILVEKNAKFTAPFGKYEFRIRRGPEFNEVRSGFELEPNAQGGFEAYVPRRVPMRKAGWYSGDLLAATTADTTRRWMRADDLDLVATTAPILSQASSVSTSNTERERKPTENGRAPLSDAALNPQPLEHVQTGTFFMESTGQGGVVIHRSSNLIPKTASTIEAIQLVAHDEQAHIEIARPWDRDVPLLLTTGMIDSVQVLSEHLLPDEGRTLTSNIRNPDPVRFKGKKALGRLAEFVYWQMLEAGLHLPPTAGSGFDGKILTQLGYNRVYVLLDESTKRDPEAWWQRLKAGHTIVTNGPLMTCSINGLPPGSRIAGSGREPIPLNIELELTVRDPVEYLDVVFNGAPIYQARLEDHAKRGEFPDLTINESGWLVLRVVTEHDKSYRMTTTAPFYFDFDSRPRISRTAVKFFSDWLDASADLIEKDSKIQSNATAQAAYRVAVEKARTFWTEKTQQANAE